MQTQDEDVEIVFSQVIEVHEKERTSDVISDGSFKSLLLAQSTLDNLIKHGFKKPSPVQVKAIPPGMAGLDMLVQAKSGTGKTLVFAILAVENLKLSTKTVQKLVIAPTREIAVQIGETIRKIAVKGARIAVMTGGSPVHEDKEKLKMGVHIVVGTTGRLCQLVNEESLNLNSVSLFVLDEADKMMSGEFGKEVNFLYSCVGSIRQVAVFSATYPPHLASSLIPFLRSPIHVRLNVHDVQLIGVKQYATLCFETDPINAIITLFSSIQFKQAFVFCNKAGDCPVIVNRLLENGMEAAAISAQLEQSQRHDVIKRLKNNMIKIIVSTDLTARGIDADNVDLVINIEPPFEVETYFHRIGRAARYGGQGASLTILSTKKSLSRFAYLVKKGQLRAKVMKLNTICPTLTTDRVFFDGLPLFISDGGNRRKDKDDETSVRRNEIEDEDPPQKTAHKCSNEEEDISPGFSDLFDSAMNLSSSLRRIPALKEETKIMNGTKKFKFIPFRWQKSTKYYMKGEMNSIRDAFTCDEWKEYAREKFDMTKEPFIMDEYEGTTQVGENKKYSKSEASIIDVRPCNSSSSAMSHNGIREYKRKDLIAISKSKQARVWKEYALSKWNVKEDPFVEDSSMRCTYSQQIRLKRQREKAERDKIVAERNVMRVRLISLGTNVSQMKEWEGTFDDYCGYMKEEMERTKGGQRRGAIVYKRRGKNEYIRNVEESKRILERIEKTFEYSLNMALDGMNEREAQTDTEMMAVNRKEEIVVEVKKEGKGIEENEAEEDEECEEHDENEISDVYEEDTRGNQCEMDEFEIYNDANARSRFHSAYNRNIEFSKVFDAYLFSMSTLQ